MIVPLNRTIKLKKQQQSPIITEKHTHGKTAERESGSDQRERERERPEAGDLGCGDERLRGASGDDT